MLGAVITNARFVFFANNTMMKMFEMSGLKTHTVQPFISHFIAVFAGTCSQYTVIFIISIQQIDSSRAKYAYAHILYNCTVTGKGDIQSY